MSWGKLTIKDPRSIMTKEEFDKLLASVDREDFKLIMETCFTSGCRIGEIVGNRLRRCQDCQTLYHTTRPVVDGKTEKGHNIWRMKYLPTCPKCGSEKATIVIDGGLRTIDVKDGEIWVKVEKKKQKTYENSYINSDLERKLLDYAAKMKRKPDERIFKMSRNRAHELIKRYLAASEIADKNVHMHTIRHTAIKWLMQNATLDDLPLIQKQVHHSDPNITLGYNDLIDRQRKEFMRRVLG